MNLRSAVFLVLAFQLAGPAFADDAKDAKKSVEYPREHPKSDKHSTWHDVEAAAKATGEAQEASMKTDDAMKAGEKENNQVNPCNGDHPPSWCS